MLKKLFLFVGILVVALFLTTGVVTATALFGKAQSCPSGPGALRNEKELLLLIETRGLSLTDAEATALVQKSLSQKLSDPRICFSPGLLHLSGRIKAGRLSPSFYISTGVDLSGPTPKTKGLDIRIGGVPNFFIFTPIEKMIEGAINDKLSQMKIEEKFLVEFKEGSATIKRFK